ncbi:fatty acid desaturase [Chitiniphilus purpureus]|uniref:Fatty acid desaturase n=1 Tax=Chitiniphilus purpureus TaxID=2981137 RepID=A0ABY6DGZ0_9NEIS|nr:fatty acid desaturase [Chitiniphilus sp. CD1]UXY13620.1 fatty acid desaturase [Chitiniphilus sp. CD1]
MTFVQQDASVRADPAMNIQDGARLTVKSRYLEVPRLVHASAILVLPTLGTALALWYALDHGVSGLDLALFAVMYVVSFVGITVGYHRHFTHRAFKTHDPIRFILGVFGSTACQGPVNYWVSNHRRHHRYTDQPGDIHSPYIQGETPLHGWRRFWHSHIGWTFSHDISNTAVAAPDLIRDPVARTVTSTYYLWVALGFALPAAIGGLVTQSWAGALSGLLWGGLVRLFVIYHSIHAITSLAHMWGHQTYKGGNHARNNFLMSIFTWGEAWHNNHHTFPGSAMFGLRWWQIDLGGYVIQLLRLLGLAWDVRVPPAHMRDGLDHAPQPD